MLFYSFLPPLIRMNYDEILECSRRRMQYFLFNLEYHMQMDPKTDEISHLILKFFALAMKNPAVEDFMLEGELELFMERLNACDVSLVEEFTRRSLVYTTNSLNHLGEDDDLSATKAARDICMLLVKTPSVGMHFFKKCCSCCKYQTNKVPIKVCPELLASRSINLLNGFTTIPCSSWREFLAGLFKIHYHSSVQFLRPILSDLLKKDERWSRILQELRRTYHRISTKQIQTSAPLAPLLAENVDKEAALFPLCMRNLMVALRREHRLPHRERIALQYFLKDIGMRVEEAVVFWKEEYTKKEGKGAVCCHSWEEREKKFLYSIRYTYGLEGAMIEKRGKNCSKIQNANDDIGCPFVSYSDHELKTSLNSDNPEVTERILHLKQQGFPSSACHLSLTSTSQMSKRELKNPADFYLRCKSCRSGNHYGEMF